MPLIDVDSLSMEDKVLEYQKCALYPIYFIETYLEVFDQTQNKKVPFKMFPDQRQLVRNYTNHLHNITNKYRQAGITTVTDAWIAWYMSFQADRTVAIVADKKDTARDEILKEVCDFIDSLPEFLHPGMGDKDSEGHKRYGNGSQIKAYATNSLRGYTPTLIFWDETAHCPDGDKFWTSASATLNTGGKAIFVSCVTEDTYLYTDGGIMQMKDFIKDDKTVRDAYEIEPYRILGAHKVRQGTVFFQNGWVDTLKIKTAYSQLESSYNHKYWAYSLSDKEYGWYRASDLKVGDYVSIQYGMDIWGDNDDVSDFKPTQNGKIKNVFNPGTLTGDVCYLLGLFLSEGSTYIPKNKQGLARGYSITITCGDDISGIFQKLNLPYYTDGLHYTVSSKNLGEFLIHLGFDLKKKAKHKTIPARLLQTNRNNIIALLQGIMDGDGYATYGEKRNRLRVGITLASKEMVEQIRMILMNFGVLTDYNERITLPTKKVKVSSMGYRITACGENAVTYFREIGFRFSRKENILSRYNPDSVKHAGVTDNIPNGIKIGKELFKKIKYYGIHDELKKHGISIKHQMQHTGNEEQPMSRKTLLSLLDMKKEIIGKQFTEQYSDILGHNIYWAPVKEIKQSQNHTFDFSLPDTNPETNDFHHSVIYNGNITHQTPNGLDSVFFKTFDGAINGKNDFHAFLIYWYSDPRYNKGLKWVNGEDVIETEDTERFSELVRQGYAPTSPWFEETCKRYNGDLRKIAQELECVHGDTQVTVRNKNTGVMADISIGELYGKASPEKHFQVRTPTGFRDFGGMRVTRKPHVEITCPGTSLKCSTSHLLLTTGGFTRADELKVGDTLVGEGLLATVSEVSGIREPVVLYDLLDVDGGHIYLTNGVTSHNCSFLGSGANLVSEEHITAQEKQNVRIATRTDGFDGGVWVWEEPEVDCEYVMGADVSLGTSADYSSFSIINIKSRRQVCEYQGKLSPENLGILLNTWGRRYNNAYAVVDVNGAGAPTVSKLLELGYPESSMHYSEIRAKPLRDRLQRYIRMDGEKELVPGFLISSNRPYILQELERQIRMDEIVIRSTRFISELKTFVLVEGIRFADHRRSFHDDVLMANALAMYAIQYCILQLGNSREKNEAMLSAWMVSGENREPGQAAENREQPERRADRDDFNPYDYGWLMRF